MHRGVIVKHLRRAKASSRKEMVTEMPSLSPISAVMDDDESKDMGMPPVTSPAMLPSAAERTATPSASRKSARNSV